ncbi:MAG: transcription elongation factor GreA, partial [Microgenomates group bacterium]
MANQKTPTIELTQEGFDELQTELSELRDVKLPAVISRVAKAREHGDLSENAEYHSAQDDQQLVETRIAEIESILSKAKVVQHTKSTVKVGIGSTVEVKKTGQKKTATFT